MVKNEVCCWMIVDVGFVVFVCDGLCGLMYWVIDVFVEVLIGMMLNYFCMWDVFIEGFVDCIGECFVFFFEDFYCCVVGMFGFVFFVDYVCDIVCCFFVDWDVMFVLFELWLESVWCFEVVVVFGVWQCVGFDVDVVFNIVVGFLGGW